MSSQSLAVETQSDNAYKSCPELAFSHDAIGSPCNSAVLSEMFPSFSVPSPTPDVCFASIGWGMRITSLGGSDRNPVDEKGEVEPSPGVDPRNTDAGVDATRLEANVESRCDLEAPPNISAEAFDLSSD